MYFVYVYYIDIGPSLNTGSQWSSCSFLNWVPFIKLYRLFAHLVYQGFGNAPTYTLGIQSPKLRRVSWNLNTVRFGGDYTPSSTSDKVIGSLGIENLIIGRLGMLNVKQKSHRMRKAGNTTRRMIIISYVGKYQATMDPS